MKRWLAIANPHAGAFRFGDFRVRWMPQLERVFERVEYTRAPGHASELACAAADYDGIAVIGGDGTLFEVLAGTRDPAQLHAIVPAGRGNCLALDLGVGTVPEALRTVTDGEAFGLDLMDVELDFADGSRRGCRAASTLAAGYVARVVERATHLSALRRYAYATSALFTRPRRFEIRAGYDGAAQCELLTSVVVNNTRHLANFSAFPDASLDDGLLDVLELDAAWAAQMMHNASVLSRRYFYNPGRAVRARSIEFEFPIPGLIMIDGELAHGVSRCRVRALPAAARFLRRPAS
jgi:diacylglycerol kinase family enzyme